MNLQEAMMRLERLGSEQTRRVWQKYGASGPMFGVKIGDMQKLVRKIKKDHRLSIELYNTNNIDAMYLAALIADEKRVSREQLHEWVQAARWHMVGEYALAGLAGESPHGWDLGLEWIDHQHDHVSAAGWATLGAAVSVRDDDELNLYQLEDLLARTSGQIHGAPNRTRFAMNNFIISVGVHVAVLLDEARSAAERVGKVLVNLGEEQTNAPLAMVAIEKAASSRRHGRKRKRVRS